MEFPIYRGRRTRRNDALRAMVRETHLLPTDFIYPLFIVAGKDVREPIKSMPGVERFSVDRIAEEAREVSKLGVPAVILFGIPDSKDPEGTGAWDDEGVVPLATKEIKNAAPELQVICDVCLCEYTSHGHCGPLRQMPACTDEQEVDTFRMLCRTGKHS